VPCVAVLLYGVLCVGVAAANGAACRTACIFASGSIFRRRKKGTHVAADLIFRSASFFDQGHMYSTYYSAPASCDSCRPSPIARPRRLMELPSRGQMLLEHRGGAAGMLCFSFLATCLPMRRA
jgi:hypothetical protein